MKVFSVDPNPLSIPVANRKVLPDFLHVPLLGGQQLLAHHHQLLPELLKVGVCVCERRLS